MPGPLPVPAVEIIVDGSTLAQEYVAQLLDVQVRDNLLLPDTAVVRFRDPLGEFIERHPLQPGVVIEIKMGARKDNGTTRVFIGEVVALEPEFGEGDCVISARAYDRGHRLLANRRSQTFQDQKAEDMISSVIGRVGLNAGTMESTTAVHPFFQQSMETDWEFCRRLAAMNDFELVVDDRSVNFYRREAEAPVAVLEWGGTLLTFKPRLSAMGQVEAVTVNGHDPRSRQDLAATASTPQMASRSGAVDKRSALVGKVNANGRVVVGDRVVETQAEATQVAQTTLDRLASTFVEASGKAVGNPRLRARKTVEIKAVGSFSGQYVLSETTHTFRGGSEYTTGFVISGRTGHGFSDLTRNGEGRAWSSSLVLGVVTNNNDPEQLGRVRVTFPQLGPTMEGWWARVATLNAGDDRGIFMLPEVNDQVVVAFENGDPRRPFVIGSLYDGQAKVPDDMLDPTREKAAFGLKSDHKVHVEGQQEMKLRSHEKMTVLVDRDAQGGTGDFLLDAKGNIEDKAAQNIKGTAGQSIELTANQSVTIKGTGSVTVETSGSLKLKGSMIDIQSSGPVNVKGSIINLG